MKPPKFWELPIPPDRRFDLRTRRTSGEFFWAVATFLVTSEQIFARPIQVRLTDAQGSGAGLTSLSFSRAMPGWRLLDKVGDSFAGSIAKEYAGKAYSGEILVTAVRPRLVVQAESELELLEACDLAGADPAALSDEDLAGLVVGRVKVAGVGLIMRHEVGSVDDCLTALWAARAEGFFFTDAQKVQGGEEHLERLVELHEHRARQRGEALTWAVSPSPDPDMANPYMPRMVRYVQLSGRDFEQSGCVFDWKILFDIVGAKAEV